MSPTPRACRAATAVLTLALLVGGARLPLWQMTLHAPQYVGGLRLVIDGRGVHGDVDELNALNHYIGMAPIRMDRIPEARLFTPGVTAVAAGVLVAALTGWRFLRALALVGLWALPLAFLADLQWRLYLFGHSMDPLAAFRLPAFTPKVVGRTVVMNFDVTALPGIGLVLMLLAAVVFAVGPRAARRAHPALRRLVPAAAVLALAVAGSAATARGESPPFDLARAVAAAPPGAVVVVPPGVYPGPLVLARPLVLRGQGRPVIDGRGAGDVVVITGERVTLEGFAVRGGSLLYSREAAGIVVRGAGAVVRDNEIDDVLFGVYLAGARGAVVAGNTIRTAALPVERRGHAVYLWHSREILIADNRILRGKDGIHIAFSNETRVERNLVTDSRYGLHVMYSHRNVYRNNVFLGNVVGAAVMYSSDVTLDHNVFEGSRSVAAGAGLIFKDADRLLVRGNRIARNRVGLEFDNTPAERGGWAQVEENLVAFNEVGFSLMSTAAIAATGNTVVENLRPVEVRGVLRTETSRWQVAGRGNYWGDYRGFDASGDGIGDVPYRRADVLERLGDRAPALRAFLFTPAHLALEAAVRLAPLARVDPVVEDPAPLIRAPGGAPGGAPAPAGRGLLVAGVLLLAPGLLAAARLRAKRAP
ncbi:MAG: nitrous oxide reductase family maturation protein NosD [Armatimonadota bacterium]|nr:nitrous oxide reductase family maturation protein NosD [Armatimonadota bacterium]